MHKILLLIILILTACKSTENKSQQNAAPHGWNESMRNLQQNLTEIEPYLFDSKKFTDPKNKSFLQDRISKMAKESKDVNHNPTLMHRDPTVRFVASRFSQDLQNADQAFNEGKISYARYELIKITSSCVQCHTRTQQGSEVTFSFNEPFLKSIGAADQVEYLIASRKFSQAFKVASEAAASSQKMSIWDMDRIAKLGLTIAVQYEQNPVWAEDFVKKLQKNQNISYSLKSQTSEWMNSIQAWKKEPKNQAVSLTRAQNLVRKNKSTIDVMRALPMIIGILSKENKPQDTGELLLLAGEAYESLYDFTSQELHENYYEACIKSFPHSAIAKKCFSKLENSITIGYSGSSGVHIPIETKIWLDKLRSESE